MRNIAIISCLLTAFTGLSFAQGTTGFELMRTEVSSRGASLAGAMSAVESGVDGLFYNPAALGTLEGHHTELTYFKHLLDIESGFLAYGRNIPGYGTAAIGVNYINYGAFDEATAYGELTGETFRAADFVFTAGFGRKAFNWLSLGANVKYARSEIWDRVATAYALDMGLLIFTPWDNTKIGFTACNIGKTIEGYYDYQDKLPLTYKLGVSKPLAHLPLVILLQLEQAQDNDLYFAAGGEFTISEIFLLRLGWNSHGADQRVDSNNDIFAGVSGGFGFAVSGVFFDYAVNSWGELGTLMRFTIGGKF